MGDAMSTANELDAIEKKERAKLESEPMKEQEEVILFSFLFSLLLFFLILSLHSMLCG